MADCGFLLSAHTTATGQAQHADDEIVRLQEEATMLVDLVGTVERLIGEQEAFIQSVTDQMATLIADRIADIDAVDARIAEILALLDGGVDRPPVEGEDRAALEEELLELVDLFDVLAPERAALLAGQTGGTTLESAIDGLTEARIDATELLGQMQRDKASFETRIADNGTQQQVQSEAQNAALDEAERIRGLAVGAGCEWATGGTPPVDEPEEPEEPQEPDDPEEPEEPVDEDPVDDDDQVDDEDPGDEDDEPFSE